MVEVTITYTGQLRCSAVHGPSGQSITTDAPKDNKGKGEAFSPTDLVGTALGSCILTTMAIKADTLGVNLSGARIIVKKEMAASPRRIARLELDLFLPSAVAVEHREPLQRAALACPVHQSLHPDVQMPINFRWEM